jgi:hypothetical protein
MLGATLVAKGKAEGDAQNSVAGWYEGSKGYKGIRDLSGTRMQGYTGSEGCFKDPRV